MLTDIQQYHRPENLKEAIELLGENSDRVLLAGGTSLIPDRENIPAEVVDIQNLPLTEFERNGGKIVIGALTHIAEIQKSKLLKDNHLEILRRTALDKPSQLIRNQSTLGGEIARASSRSELLGALLALGARVNITGKAGKRSVEISDFYGKSGKASLEQTDIITSVEFELPLEKDRIYYERLSRTENDVGLVSLSLWGRPENGGYNELRIGATGISNQPVRLNNIEALARETVDFDETFEERLEEAVDESIHPPVDFRASAEYRKHVLKVFLRRAFKLEEAPGTAVNGK